VLQVRNDRIACFNLLKALTPPYRSWRSSAFIAKARGNQSSFYNNLDIGTYSMHIHASINVSRNNDPMRTTNRIDEGPFQKQTPGGHID
jgi:hypothetical protein